MSKIIDWINRNRYAIFIVSLVSFFSGYLTIYTYFFPNIAPNQKEYNKGKIENPIYSKVDSVPSRPTTKSNSNKPGTIAPKDTSVEKNNFPLVVADSLARSVDTKDSIINNQITSEFLEYNHINAKEYYSSEGDVTQMSEPPPREGFGKLAVRSYCDYADKAYYEAKITITDTLGRSHSGFINAMYNPLRRRETTYFRELLPGKYYIKLEYHEIGNAEFEVEIFENKLSLYRYKKLNPFGIGNAQIVLVTEDDVTNKWKITLDDVFLGVKTIKPNEAIYINVKGGKTHYYRIETLVPNSESTTLDIQSGPITLFVGERFYKTVN